MKNKEEILNARKKLKKETKFMETEKELLKPSTDVVFQVLLGKNLLKAIKSRRFLQRFTKNNRNNNNKL